MPTSEVDDKQQTRHPYYLSVLEGEPTTTQFRRERNQNHLVAEGNAQVLSISAFAGLYERVAPNEAESRLFFRTVRYHV